MATVKFLPCAAGEGDHAQHGGGGSPRSLAPSTTLRAVPLPRSAGEDVLTESNFIPLLNPSQP